MPCGTQLFGPDAAQVAMPWRGAGGEAHPMTAVGRVFPGYGTDLAAVHGFCDAGAGPLPTEDQVPANPLLIFEQLILDTAGHDHPAPPEVDWESMLNAPPEQFPADLLDQGDAADRAWHRVPSLNEQPRDWSNAPTRRLPVVAPRRPWPNGGPGNLYP
jgi:hypothetical protein